MEEDIPYINEEVDIDIIAIEEEEQGAIELHYAGRRQKRVPIKKMKKCEIKKKGQLTKVNEVLPVIHLALNQLVSLIFKE